MVINGVGDEHTGRLCQSLQARRDVHPVAEYVVALSNDIPEVDPNTEPDPMLLGLLGLALDHPLLHRDRAPHCIQHARELRQKAVAGVLDDATSVFAYFRIDQFSEMRL